MFYKVLNTPQTVAAIKSRPVKECPEAIIGGVKAEKLQLNILQTSQENSCVGVSFGMQHY